MLDPGGVGLRIVEDLALRPGDDDVRHGDGRARASRPVEARLLQGVERSADGDLLVPLGQGVDDPAEDLLVDRLVDVGEVHGERVVEDRAAQTRLQAEGLAVGAAIGGLEVHGRGDVPLEADEAPRVQVELAEVHRHPSLGDGGEVSPFAGQAVAHARQVEQPDDHVLGGHGHRTAVRGFEDVVRGEHEDARLGLGLHRQRQMDGHLVPVEVGVEGAAHERVQADGLALDELRLEGLDAQAVKRRRPVEEDGVFLDDLFEDVPHFGTLPVDETLGRLDVLGDVEVHEPLLDEGLEQLERHDRRQAALVEFEGRTHDDDAATRVIHALAQKVLAEAPLLALEHVGQGLQRPVASALDGAAASAVVEEGVHGLLEHALLVVHHDLGGPEVEHALEAVVAVDDAAIEVVEVGGGEAAAVELHHGAQVGRDDRKGVEHHGRGLGPRVQEGVDDLDALEGAGLALGGAGLDDLDEVVALGLQIEGLQAPLDGLGAPERLEVVGVARLHLAVEVLVPFEIADLELGEALPHGVQALQVEVGALADAG